MTAWAAGALTGAAVVVLSLPAGSRNRLHALPGLRRWPGEQLPHPEGSSGGAGSPGGGWFDQADGRIDGPRGRLDVRGGRFGQADGRMDGHGGRLDGHGGRLDVRGSTEPSAGNAVMTRGRLGAPAIGAVVLVSGLLGGPALAVLALTALLAGRGLLAARMRNQARDSERRRGLEACAALAAELRAGSSPAAALDVAAGLATGRVGEAFRAATAAARLGGDVPGALARSADSSAMPEALRGLAACWQVCARAGSGLAAAVERLADGLRARRQQEEAVAAALAGPRASAALLAGLPAVGVALAAGLGARPLHVLLHTAVGLGCLALGVGFDVLGLWWTHRLVDRAARAAG